MTKQMKKISMSMGSGSVKNNSSLKYLQLQSTDVIGVKR